MHAHHHTDTATLQGLSFRAKQRVNEPHSIVVAARSFAERMAKTRPHDAAWLSRLIDAYEAREVAPSVEFAEGLQALARALRHPEQVPEEAEAP